MDCDYIPTKKSKRQLKKEKRGMSEEQFINKMNEEKSSLGSYFYFSCKCNLILSVVCKLLNL